MPLIKKEMANKGARDLIVLGALGAAAAAGYFIYGTEKKELGPQGSKVQIKNESQIKPVEKPQPKIDSQGMTSPHGTVTKKPEK